MCYHQRPLHLLQYISLRQAGYYSILQLPWRDGGVCRIFICWPCTVFNYPDLLEFRVYFCPAGHHHHRQSDWSHLYLLLLSTLLQEPDYQLQRAAFYHIRRNDPWRNCFRPGAQNRALRSRWNVWELLFLGGLRTGRFDDSQPSLSYHSHLWYIYGPSLKASPTATKALILGSAGIRKI